MSEDAKPKKDRPVLVPRGYVTGEVIPPGQKFRGRVMTHTVDLTNYTITIGNPDPDDVQPDAVVGG